MSRTLSRRQWLVRSGTALGGAMVAGYAGIGRGLVPEASARPDAPIRMMFNENPYGPSAVARKAMIAAFDEGNLYSRAAYNELRELIAAQVGLTPDHILIGSGSREILNVAALQCGLQDGEVVTPHPTFEALNNYAETIGAKVHRVPLDESLHFDLASIRAKVTPNVKLVYLCNPNNPTGTITPAAELRPLCEELAERCLVFVDEAYHEYVTDPAYRSMVELVREGHNVIVSRTASKIHGLAGLRVGFGIADPERIQHLQERVTGTTNIIGLRAAIASYRDKEFQTFSLKKNEESKQILYNLFRETGHRFVPSHTNFIFVHTGRPIKEFQQAMKEQGFLVGRPFPPYLDWCRVSLAKPGETMRFAQAFRAIMDS